MSNPKTFPFDVEQMTEFFKGNDFIKAFATPKIPDFDTDALLDAQKKNMDALVKANKAAAAGYQELHAKQVEVFEATLAEAQKQISAFDPASMNADAAQAQGEVAKAAFEKALENMTALAEGAKKANSDAFEVVSDRIQDSVAELQEMAKKLAD